MYLLTDILQEWIGVEKEESSVPLTSFQKEEKEEDEDEQLLHKINEQIRNIYQVIRHSLSPKEEEEDNDESPVPEASYSLSMEADKRPALFSDAFVHLAGDEVYFFNSFYSVDQYGVLEKYTFHCRVVEAEQVLRITGILLSL